MTPPIVTELRESAEKAKQLIFDDSKISGQFDRAADTIEALLGACEQAEAHIVEHLGIAPKGGERFADNDVSVQQLRAAIAKARS
jgi:hypothetical protein